MRTAFLDRPNPRRRFRCSWQSVVLAVLVAMLVRVSPTAAQTGNQSGVRFPLEAKRILFLGDSNTYAGQYISWLDAQLQQALPKPPELINLGLPSETCTGLSEPDHPFPRPNVHERLARALTSTKPDVVVVGYGMNDGIYYPFDEQRFIAYQQGITKLLEAIRQSGAKSVLLTPPPFDSLPMRKQGKLLPQSADKYAWSSIYEDYDDVMKRYAEWILEQTDLADMVIDVHSTMNDYLAQKRRQDPNFVMSNDGVHFDAEGHRVLGEKILRSWGLSPVELPAEKLQRATQRSAIMRDAWLTEVGHTRPGMKAGLSLEKARETVRQLQERRE